MRHPLRARIFLILALMPAMTVILSAGQAAKDALSQRKIALALEQQGKNVEAETAWRLYLKDSPSSPEPYAHLGLLEARQERYREAVPLYRKALAMNPAIPGLRMNLGLALFKGGSLKEAISEFTQLLNAPKVSPEEAYRLRVLIAMAYYGQGEFSAAIPFLKEAAAADPRNLEIRLLLAHSCMWTKQNQCVLDTYKEILTIDPESAEADIMAGEALDEKQDFFGAIQQFRAAVKANPKVLGVHFGLGYLLWKQRQYPEAAVELQAELTNNPYYAPAMAYLADADMHLGYSEASLPLLEKAIHIDPSIEQAHLDLGILYADAGRTEDALRELTEAEKQAPDDVNVLLRLGRLYRSMGRNEEAKAEFEKASTLNKKINNALVDEISGGHAKDAPANSSPDTSAGK